MVPKFRWEEVAADATTVLKLAGALGLPRPVARVLVARGVTTPDEAVAFLSPELKTHLGHPFEFPGARAAAERLWAAVREGREIVVFGDFDADGVAAAAVLATALRHIGAAFEVFLPVRETEGYGLTFAALERCLRERGRAAGVLVTVDCGISSVAEVAYLREQGIAVIITDHHEPGAELPLAEVIVNPRLGASKGAEHLCGAGVAFKVAHALVEVGKAQGWYQGSGLCGELLAPVGLATVTDVVPLIGENRLFVSSALKHWGRFAGEGLRALLSRASSRTVETLDAYTFGFILGPRINAAGRMDSAMVAYELLTTRDRDRAAELAVKLEGFNGKRKGIEERIIAAARQQCGLDAAEGALDAAAVVVGSDGQHAGETGWHPGVIGIVAARLSDAAGRPAAVVAFDAAGAGRGSVRAGEGYHALKALAAAGEALAGFGGHERAAGFHVKPGAFEQFKRLFCEACASQALAGGAARRLVVDGWLEPEQISIALCIEQQRLAPFGMGNPAPRWGLRGVAVERAQPVGASGEHLQLTFKLGQGERVRGIWFRHGDVTEAVRAAGGLFDVVFELCQNDFGGDKSAELRVVDMASAGDRTACSESPRTR
jgi:single-stranded-DNA-specific exonuclease